MNVAEPHDNVRDRWQPFEHESLWIASAYYDQRMSMSDSGEPAVLLRGRLARGYDPGS
jgi:hypothetical protein